ncbi:MAG: potassium channel family protein [Acidimicrobiales bacterium]
MTTLGRLKDWIGQRNGDGPHTAESVFLIGLGRFGSAMAARLVELGVEVMAVDSDAELVNAWADRITHVRRADATRAAVLDQLGATDFDAAVVAIGTGMEASILSTAALVDVGCDNIWAKAMSDRHGRILERVGAHRVVYPERQMGERVAHLVTGQVVDYFQLEEGFVLAEIEAPAALHGMSLGEAGVRQEHGVTVVCIKPRGGLFTYATAETVVGAGDLLLIAGTVDDAERFAEYASS